jgi:ATP-dependent phosphoenolpyruvate carboxykinase
MTKDRQIAGAMERNLAPGLHARGMVHWNLRPAALYEHAVRRDEGRSVRGGPFSTITAPHTGQSPNDKFLVREPIAEGDIWWGSVNQPMHQIVLPRCAMMWLGTFPEMMNYSCAMSTLVLIPGSVFPYDS